MRKKLHGLKRSVMTLILAALLTLALPMVALPVHSPGEAAGESAALSPEQNPEQAGESADSFADAINALPDEACPQEESAANDLPEEEATSEQPSEAAEEAEIEPSEEPEQPSEAAEEAETEPTTQPTAQPSEEEQLEPSPEPAEEDTPQPEQLAVSAASDCALYRVGDTITWRISCLGAQRLSYTVTAPGGEILAEECLEDSLPGEEEQLEVCCAAQEGGIYEIIVTAGFGDGEQSTQAQAPVSAGELAATLSTRQRYAMVDRKSMEYIIAPEGGVAPYTAVVCVELSGRTLHEDVLSLSESTSYAYMPVEFGVHRITLCLTDSVGESVCASASLPVAVPETESSAEWEASARTSLGRDWRERLVSVASTQLGYRESERNFIIDETGVRGYSRYGDWYGKPYAEWSAMFVSFCLHYANVPEGSFPQAASCGEFRSALKAMGIYEGAAYLPQRGDLVFLKGDGSAASERVGIVERVSANSVDTIEGGSGRSVSRCSYALNGSAIIGYGNMTAAMRRAGLCCCGAQADDGGRVRHAEHCPLYTAEEAEPSSEAPTTEEESEPANEEALQQIIEDELLPASEEAREPANEEAPQQIVVDVLLPVSEEALQELIEDEPLPTPEEAQREDASEEMPAPEDMPIEADAEIERSVNIMTSRDTDELQWGSRITLSAELRGYEGASYVCRWQYAQADREGNIVGEWQDAECDELSISYELSRENILTAWRVCVTVNEE